MAAEVQKRRGVSWYYETKSVFTAGSEFRTEFSREPSLTRSFYKWRNFIEAGCTSRNSTRQTTRSIKHAI